MLFAEIASIDRLTEAGAGQLAADLSHWSKVLGAGEMEPGGVLVQAIGLLKMNGSELARAGPAKAGEDGELITLVRGLRQAGGGGGAGA